MTRPILDIVLLVVIIALITLVVFTLPAPYWAKLQLALLTAILVK